MDMFGMDLLREAGLVWIVCIHILDGKKCLSLKGMRLSFDNSFGTQFNDRFGMDLFRKAGTL